MKKLKVHDRVKIIDRLELGEPLEEKTGIIITTGRYDSAEDDVIVRLDRGGIKRLKTHQLMRIDLER